jgi:hypothetical protein
VQQNANQAISDAKQQVAIVQGEGQVAIDNAQATLQGVQDSAAVAEANADSAAAIARAQANTQFAGTGTVVNIYGVPVSDAGAIGDAVSWVARTSLQTA